jgi:hypothetical protein
LTRTAIERVCTSASRRCQSPTTCGSQPDHRWSTLSSCHAPFWEVRRARRVPYVLCYTPCFTVHWAR